MIAGIQWYERKYHKASNNEWYANYHYTYWPDICSWRPVIVNRNSQISIPNEKNDYLYDTIQSYDYYN
jgi:hypothetical protein